LLTDIRQIPIAFEARIVPLAGWDNDQTRRASRSQMFSRNNFPQIGVRLLSHGFVRLHRGARPRPAQNPLLGISLELPFTVS
jgi:hypothetical protein